MLQTPQQFRPQGNFYSNKSDKNGKATKKLTHIAGDNATWNFKNGILTISGYGPLLFPHRKTTGTPDLQQTAGISTVQRIPPGKLTQTRSEKYYKKQETQVFEKGPLFIFPELKEVDIQKGVTKIGKEAFAYVTSYPGQHT